MKRVTISEYGTPDVLDFEEIASPKPGSNDLLVELKATSINPIDLKIRKGDLKFITGRKFPKILGADFSGIVKESNNSLFNIGDEVFGLLNPMKGGAYSEEIIVEGKNCLNIPNTLTLEESAVIPVVGQTAYEGLIKHGKLKRGDSVFINGCTGGVGSFAVQIAKAVGAEITGTCSEKNIDFAKKIGTDKALDYLRFKVSTGIEKYDVVLDTTGKLTPKQFRKLGKRFAKFSTTGFNFKLLIKSIISNSLKLIVVKPDQEKLKELKEFIDKHNIKPVITERRNFADIKKVHLDIEKNGGRGKTMIIIK